MDKTGNDLSDRSRSGLIGQWVGLSAGLVGRAIGTGFGVLHDVRAEIAVRVGATIDWVDGSQQGTMRLVRTVHRRVDDLWKDTLEAGEQAVTGLLHGVHATSDEATKFAARRAGVCVDGPPAN